MFSRAPVRHAVPKLVGAAKTQRWKRTRRRALALGHGIRNRLALQGVDA